MQDRKAWWYSSGDAIRKNEGEGLPEMERVEWVGTSESPSTNQKYGI